MPKRKPVRKIHKSKRKRKSNNSRIISLEHGIHDDMFIIKRADGSTQKIWRFDEPDKYARLKRTYGYSYP